MAYEPPAEPVRLRLPKKRTQPDGRIIEETFGVIDQRLGASRLRVRCLDGKTRICRIPGRLKKGLWVREGNIVIIEPWEFGGNEKGDIIYKYNPHQAKALKKKGYLQKIDDLDEF